MYYGGSGGRILVDVYEFENISKVNFQAFSGGIISKSKINECQIGGPGTIYDFRKKKLSIINNFSLFINISAKTIFRNERNMSIIDYLFIKGANLVINMEMIIIKKIWKAEFAKIDYKGNFIQLNLSDVILKSVFVNIKSNKLFTIFSNSVVLSDSIMSIFNRNSIKAEKKIILNNSKIYMNNFDFGVDAFNINFNRSTISEINNYILKVNSSYIMNYSSLNASTLSGVSNKFILENSKIYAMSKIFIYFFFIFFLIFFFYLKIKRYNFYFKEEIGLSSENITIKNSDFVSILNSCTTHKTSFIYNPFRNLTKISLNFSNLLHNYNVNSIFDLLTLFQKNYTFIIFSKNFTFNVGNIKGNLIFMLIFFL